MLPAAQETLPGILDDRDPPDGNTYLIGLADRDLRQDVERIALDSVQQIAARIDLL